MSKKIAIVGAGPGGISAAIAASETGAQVFLIDENPYVGGQIWRQKLGKISDPNSQKWISKLNSSSIKFSPGTTVQSFLDQKLICSNTSGQKITVEADKVILANGARELFLPFPGWTLPNVVGCGGIQALVKSGLDVKNKKIVIAGTGPLMLAVAAYLKKSGAQVAGIFEQAPSSKLNKFVKYLLFNQPSKIKQGISLRLKTLSTPIKNGWWVKSALGSDKLSSVEVTNGAEIKKVDCDYLACGFGLIPNSELASILGCELHNGFVKVNENQETAVSGIYAVGELTGIGGVDKALFEGETAGRSAAGSPLASSESEKMKNSEFVKRLEDTYALREEVKLLAESETIFCRCEDVSYGDVCSQSDQRTAKLYTRCGMGACQGKICSAMGQELFGWSRNKIKSPLIPVDIESLIS